MMRVVMNQNAPIARRPAKRPAATTVIAEAIVGATIVLICTTG
jgi:hypothetical protein